MHLLHLEFGLAIVAILIGITPYSSWVQTSFSVLVSQNPQKPPDKDPPPGRRVRGGDLDPTNLNCKKTSQPLTAIVPANSQGKITSEHFTLWFYVPYTPEDITSAEFSVLNRDETEYVYQILFTLPKTPGIVSISLPLSAKTSLETGKFYHWYLTLKCKGSKTNTPDIEMDGWVQQILPKPSINNQINTTIPEVWYDDVNNLANRILAFPQDTKLKQEWTDLLKSVGLSNLAQEPLIGPVQISK
jgi:Domain of Unknown Function (DUF928)